MPQFSEVSKKRLATCHPMLQELMNEVIKYYDCIILCGNRGEEDQNKAYHDGKSKLKYPNSKHNSIPSKAVDVGPYPLNWKDSKKFYHMMGYIKAVADQKGIKISWGGDWDSDSDFNDQTFNDLPHIELAD